MLVAPSPTALQSSLPFSLQSVMSSMQSPRWIVRLSWCRKHLFCPLQSSFDLQVFFLGNTSHLVFLPPRRMKEEILLVFDRDG